ncbi:NRDE family protein [Roseospira marina]|uniref:NRDE family protein n=1 Tax=Roseospira marina TaxID=140057 RepID=A0A5M6I9Q3_9PROT|nr:NRDE family protein [Roseospira marina]KAA5604455.1 NRDE family protein [Roseospira marina]MBB4315500.1 hypothetical protein [Roseospira marina]MBB5088563.1 hypothetical protein [Roseospira marina]
MCTLVLLRRPGHAWPLLLAANRDEMRDRPWTAPGRHWPDRPEVIAGRDDLAGGSWLGWNDHGVVAAMLNRHGTLGPQEGKRSRGELVLEALDHADARDAAEVFADLNPEAYRPFNLVVADTHEAFWVRHAGTGPVAVEALAEGLSMLTAADVNDTGDPRIAAHLPRFRAAAVPDPEAPEGWAGWTAVQTMGPPPDAAMAGAGMCFAYDSGFGTICATQIALPAPALDPRPPVIRFAAGPPDMTPFVPM